MTLSGVTTGSMILATIQQAAGSLAVANAVPGTNQFTINLTGTATGTIAVAWFVLN